jgi:hypothetical protein
VRERCAALVAQWGRVGAGPPQAGGSPSGGRERSEQGGNELDDSAGYYAFNDVHALLAMLAADDGARAEHWVARCAARALAANDAPHSNHAMARDVGAPLMRALMCFARGEHAAAAQALYAVRAKAQRFGGSHAQRDLVDQTLLAAAAADPAARALGRAVLNERRSAKPVTPLTRRWADRLGVALA